jgi:hypothetical protein
LHTLKKLIGVNATLFIFIGQSEQAPNSDQGSFDSVPIHCLRPMLLLSAGTKVMNHPLNQPPIIVRIKHVSALVGEHLPAARFSSNRIEAVPDDRTDPLVQPATNT